MAQRQEDRGLTNIAGERIARRFRGRDASRLVEFLLDERQQRALDLEAGMSRIREEIVAAIRDAEERGITRYRIAMDSGVAQSQLSRLMSGEQGLKLETAEKLCEALGIRIDIKRRKRRSRKG
jgi:transcriptional regulator with XRE-family HTH domain